MLQSLGSFERTDGVELVGVAVCLALDIVMRGALTMVFRSVRAASSARLVCICYGLSIFVRVKRVRVQREEQSSEARSLERSSGS